MKNNLNLETSGRHSSTSLPPLSTTSTPASNPMATHFRRRTVRAPLPLLALLALALTVPVREASAQWPPPVPPPIASTLPATEVTSRSATLNGTVNPNGGGYVWFDWGASTGYGNSTPSINIGPGTNAVPFSAPLLGLIPNTTYHFCAAAGRGATFFIYGDDQSFTTLPYVGPPQFNYTTNADNTITITGYYGPVAVTIPSTITGLPVTTIGERAFAEYYSLTNVTIPDSVTNIGNLAFLSCTHLTSVTIGNRVTSIGNAEFEYCTNLTNITFPNGVTSIGQGAFSGCTRLTSVTIPNNVTSIWYFAFGFCSNLTSVTIGSSVTNIANGAFEYCTSLTGVYFQGNSPSLGSYVFDGDNKATVYYLPWTPGWGATFGGRPTAVWQSPPPGAWALSASTITPTGASLNGTVNPNGRPTTASFQWGTTTDYGQLTAATGMGSGTSASPLSAPLAGLAPGITYHYRVAATNSNGAVYGSDQSFTTLPGPVQPQFTFTINNGTVTITGYIGPGGAVAIPSTMNGLPVTSIGDYAFQYCTSLTNATISNGVTSIGEYAFYECDSLTSLTIPDSVTRIGSDAFQYCTRLTNVTIGNGITSIGDDAFIECTSLTALHFGGNAPGLGGSFVFYGDTNATVYYLPGTTGWGTTFGGLPTALSFLPNPLILTSGPGFGVQSDAFGFIISWATNLPVVVEACTNPANLSWSPLKTNALTGGWSYFSDPQWANSPARFYRIRSP